MASSARILTVKILTDASGASTGIKSAEKTYGKFATAVGSKSNSAGMQVGNKLVSGIDKTLGVGLKIVGAGAAALAATALAKGFQRLNAIDQATAKLEGLGHSAAETAKIMKNANAAVKGTAFGLDEAATTAASVVAAGIKPGKELEGVLKTVADGATIAGTSMDSMGSIFAKVAAKNKLQGDVINQLTDAGIPILDLLAKHYGTTAAAASEMVSKGQVDFKNFSASMKEGMGGAALKAGDTFQGAWKNTMAALGRIGANLLGPLFTGAKDGLKGIPDLLAPIEKKAADVGRVLGEVAQWLQKNTTLLKVLGTIAGSVVAALLTFRAVVAVMNAYRTVMTVVAAAQLAYNTIVVEGAAAQKIVTAAQWAWNAAMSANPLGIIIIAVVALVAVFVLLWTKCEGFRNFFIGMWKGLQAVMAAVTSWLVSAWSSVVSWLTGVWRGYAAVWSAIWAGAKAVVAAVVSFLRSSWSAVVSWLIGVWRGYASAWSAIWSGVRAVVSAVVNWFRSAWSSTVNAVISAARSMGNFFSNVFHAMMVPINAVIGAFQSMIGWIRSVIGWISKIHIPGLPKAVLKQSVTYTPAAGPRTLTAGYGAGLRPVAAIPISAGSGNTIININGGLDSADTIARRLEQILNARRNRTSGVVMTRRTA